MQVYTAYKPACFICSIYGASVVKAGQVHVWCRCVAQGAK